MLLAQIVYLVIDVGKPIIGESCISVDMIENILNLFFFFFILSPFLSKVLLELTLSVRTCFNALAWLSLWLGWVLTRKKVYISVPVKCSLLATSLVSDFSNYTVISLHWQLKSQGIAVVYFIETRIWSALPGLIQPGVFCIVTVIHLSQPNTTIPPKGYQHTPRELLLFLHTCSMFRTISVENKDNPCLEGHETLRLPNSEISDLKFSAKSCKHT